MAVHANFGTDAYRLRLHFDVRRDGAARLLADVLAISGSIPVAEKKPQWIGAKAARWDGYVECSRPGADAGMARQVHVTGRSARLRRWASRLRRRIARRPRC